ncbi:substrate-binding domain-containing protein [Shigella flexneri]
MNSSLETLLQKRVDSLLLMCADQRAVSGSVVCRSIPVFADGYDGLVAVRVGGDVIRTIDSSAVKSPPDHLNENGFTSIAVAGPLDKSPARLRLEGYRAAMKRAGLNIPDGYEVTGDFEFNGGFDAMRQLLSHPLRPQAVFTGNDAMAVGVYQALYQAELQVPQDIAVIGYDDIELASFMTPPLTTIHQPKDELGELAIDVLIHRITQPTLQQQRLQLTPILMERGSA